MQPRQRVENEIQEQLAQLYETVSRAKRNGIDPNEVQQYADVFDMRWQDRLADAKRGALDGMAAMLMVYDNQSPRLADQAGRDQRIETALLAVDIKYANLQKGIERALDDIAMGREPNFERVLDILSPTNTEQVRENQNSRGGYDKSKRSTGLAFGR